jgi:energy-coupling factor transport system ATP-binding protein
MPLISAQDLVFSYHGRGGPDVPALRGVSLSVDRGEYVALVGANGSGKTTLALHLNGLLQPQSGRVIVDGLDASRPDLAQEVRRRVAMVFQSPLDQIVATVVEDDVAFGAENLGVAEAQLAPLTRSCLERVGLWPQRARPPHLLSAGEQQRLAIAGALAMSPRCLVLDEATSMLDPAGAAGLLTLLDELNAQGVAIVVVTHRMDEVERARRVVVLSAGCVVADGPPGAVLADPGIGRWGLEPPFRVRLAAALAERHPGLVLDGIDRLAVSLAAYVRAGGGSAPAAAAAPAAAPHAVADGVAALGAAVAAVEIRGLAHEYLRGTPLAHVALESVDFDLAAGACGVLVGATGSGKSTLLQHLNGLLLPQKGTLRVLGQDLGASRIDVVALRRRVGLVFQRPEHQIFERYVGDEVAFGPRQAGIRGPELRDRVRRALEAVGLDFEAMRDRPVFALSGGQKRLVGIAGVLAVGGAMLAADEPTAGLDPVARRRLAGLLAARRAQGMTLVIATHSMDEAAELGDRILVLGEGKSIVSGRPRDVFAEPRALAAWGLGLPPAAAFAVALRDAGVALDGRATSGRWDDLLAAIDAAVAHGGRAA